MKSTSTTYAIINKANGLYFSADWVRMLGGKYYANGDWSSDPSTALTFDCKAEAMETLAADPFPSKCAVIAL